MEEIVKDLARILVPSVAQAEEEDERDYQARVKSQDTERRRLLGELMTAMSASPQEDPVLAKLSELALRKLDIQRQISLMLAYAREFVRPEPYRLRSLAEATGMSISGVRTAYTSDDITYIATEIRRKNNKGTIFPNQQSGAQSHEQDKPSSSGNQWWALPAKTSESSSS
ncbi:hypothetical protein [Nonomuraea jabiensis]|uniref:hypothetical protein n=1 Tax=Nonomuraea jabiensis TaxID=882448 RepID=UPI003D731170